MIRSRALILVFVFSAGLGLAAALLSSNVNGGRTLSFFGKTAGHTTAEVPPKGDAAPPVPALESFLFLREARVNEASGSFEERYTAALSTAGLQTTLALRRLFETWWRADPAKALAAVIKRPNADAEWTLAACMAADPELAAKQLSLYHDALPIDLVRKMAASMKGASLDEAVARWNAAFASMDGAENLQKEGMFGICTAFARQDPKGVIERIRMEPNGRLRSMLIGSLFENESTFRPFHIPPGLQDDAIRAVLDAGADPRDAILALRERCRADPAGAVGRWNQTLPVTENASLWRRVFEEVMWRDHAAAANLAAELKKAGLDEQRVAGRLEEMHLWTNPVEALAEATRSGRMAAPEYIENRLLPACKTSPSAARAILTALAHTGMTDARMLTAGIETMAREGDADIRGFVSSLGLGSGMERSAVLTGLLIQDPAKAARFFAETPPGEEAGWAGKISAAMAREDAATALAWARTLPANQLPLALAGMMQAALPNPVAVAGELTNVLNRLDPGTMPGGGVSEIKAFVWQIAASDPKAAANWVAGLQNPAWQLQAVEAVARSWSQADPPTASEWINAIPKGEVRDRAVNTLIDNITDDPERSLLWAATIEDPAQRLKRAARLVEDWGQREPLRVAQVLGTLTLPPAERDELLARIPH